MLLVKLPIMAVQAIGRWFQMIMEAARIILGPGGKPDEPSDDSWGSGPGGGGGDPPLAPIRPAGGVAKSHPARKGNL